MHRKTDFTPELADLICERIAGGESLIKICDDGDMPSRATVFNWLAMGEKAENTEHKIFLDKYVRARETQADAIFDECLTIADNATDDVIFLTVEESDGEGARPAIKHSAIQRARLQIDTRKWMAGKLKPKKYGDKVTQEVTGENGGPVNHSITVEFVKPE